MRATLAILAALLCFASALKEFCGVSKCPPNPVSISCTASKCYSDGFKTGEYSHDVYSTTDTVNFSNWVRVPTITSTFDIRTVVAFSNGAVIAGAYNLNRNSGIIHSVDGVRSFRAIKGAPPLIGGLQHVKPSTASANNQAATRVQPSNVMSPSYQRQQSQDSITAPGKEYAFGFFTDVEAASGGAIAISPEGKFRRFSFPGNFIRENGKPKAIFAINEKSWLLGSGRGHPTESGGKLVRSDDAGWTWRTLAAPGGDFVGVSCDPTGAVCAAVCTDKKSVQMYVSSNGGVAWRMVKMVTDNFGEISYPSVAVLPKTKIIVVTTAIRAAASDDPTGHIFHSKDMGATWKLQKTDKTSQLNQILPNAAGTGAVVVGSVPKTFHGTYTSVSFK